MAIQLILAVAQSQDITSQIVFFGGGFYQLAGHFYQLICVILPLKLPFFYLLGPIFLPLILCLFFSISTFI